MSIATIYHILQAVLVLSLLNFIIGIIKPSIAFKFLKFVKEPNRTKATITTIALIVAIGILGNLPIFAPIAAQDKAEQEQQKAEQDAQEAQAKPEQDVQANTTAADNESKKKADAEAEKLRQASVEKEKQNSQNTASVSQPPSSVFYNKDGVTRNSCFDGLMFYHTMFILKDKGNAEAIAFLKTTDINTFLSGLESTKRKGYIDDDQYNLIKNDPMGFIEGFYSANLNNRLREWALENMDHLKQCQAAMASN